MVDGDRRLVNHRPILQPPHRDVALTAPLPLVHKGLQLQYELIILGRQLVLLGAVEGRDERQLLVQLIEEGALRGGRGCSE